MWSSASSEQSADDSRRRSRRLALVILALCAAPFVAAWLAYFVWPPQSRVNYGDLIDARPLMDPVLRGIDAKPFRVSQLRGKWILLQLDSGDCSEECRKKLVYMRQVRLALGKDAERVERVWLLTDGAIPEAAQLRDIQGTFVAQAAGSALLSEFPAAQNASGHIYVVDPLGNLMLRFPTDPDPRRMLKDMTRLLSVSRVG
jgi:predicted nucleic acid-binding Zn ribbon protein